jgi:hypothetical protein
VALSTKEHDPLQGPQESGGTRPTEVLEALSSILQSVPFRSSKQIQRLFQFIVSETLAGRADALKERNIGTAVFDRRPDYDTNDDPVVRLRVGELRKRLALYYQATPDQPVLISIPSGSFRAVFERGGENQAGLPQASVETPPEAPSGKATSRTPFGSPPSRLIGWIAVGASLAIGALGVLAFVPSAPERALTRFWAPVLRDSRPVLVHIGNNAVYEVSDSFKDRYHKDHPLNEEEKMGFENYYSIPPGTNVPAEDLSLVRDVYHTNGDMTATISITSLLVRRNRPFDLRYGSDLAYGDFRQYPTVLIGAHNNYWTMSMTRKLRFGFEGYDAIVDRSNPGKRWVADVDRNEDYAIVCRMLDSSDGRAFIVVAGVGNGGTSAAAAFITNGEYVAALAKSLPRGWEKKNLEVVLHASVKNQIPSNPDVVATHSW